MSNAELSRRPGRPVDEALQARRRVEILDVAASLFAEHGYSETDTEQIARDVGLSKGSLFRYFPTKRELFLAAVDRSMQQAMQYVDERRDPNLDPLDRMRQGMQAYLEFFADRPGIVHRVAQTLADRGANIVDLSTRVVGRGPKHAYVLLLELSLPPTADADALASELQGLAGELGVEIHLRPDDADVL